MADLPLRLFFQRSSWSYIFLFITKSSFGFTKIYTKSNLVVVLFLHEIKAEIWICTQFCKIIGVPKTQRFFATHQQSGRPISILRCKWRDWTKNGRARWLTGYAGPGTRNGCRCGFWGPRCPGRNSRNTAYCPAGDVPRTSRTGHPSPRKGATPVPCGYVR